MNAETLLKDDHDKVKKMLAEGEETTERAEVGRTELFAKLKEEMLSQPMSWSPWAPECWS